MNIPALRLQHQHIAQPCLTSPEQVVAWLGGLQGQDYPGAKWSIGLRLPAATEADVVQAFDTGKIVRSWPMRGTLHVVAAPDLRWMLMLTSPKNLSSSASRRRALELDDATLARCREVFIQALQGGKQLTRLFWQFFIQARTGVCQLRQLLQVAIQAAHVGGNEGHRVVDFTSDTGCQGPMADIRSDSSNGLCASASW